MANRSIPHAVTVVLLAVLWSGGCERSTISPSTLIRPSPVPVPPANSNPSQPIGLTVTAISPAAGLIGDVVRVVGTGFTPGATVTLDGVPARVTNTFSEVIVAIAPAHPAGQVDITVTNQDGQRATLPRAYAYEIVTLMASPEAVAAGAELLTVNWAAPPGRPQWDWIALIKVGESSGTYSRGWWDYTGGTATGALTLTAPAEPGRYEFRYLIDDGFGEAARSAPVTVRPSGFLSIRDDRAREK